MRDLIRVIAHATVVGVVLRLELREAVLAVVLGHDLVACGRARDARVLEREADVALAMVAVHGEARQASEEL